MIWASLSRTVVVIIVEMSDDGSATSCSAETEGDVIGLHVVRPVFGDIIVLDFIVQVRVQFHASHVSECRVYSHCERECE